MKVWIEIGDEDEVLVADGRSFISGATFGRLMKFIEEAKKAGEILTPSASVSFGVTKENLPNVEAAFDYDHSAPYCPRCGSAVRALSSASGRVQGCSHPWHWGHLAEEPTAAAEKPVGRHYGRDWPVVTEIPCPEHTDLYSALKAWCKRNPSYLARGVGLGPGWYHLSEERVVRIPDNQQKLVMSSDLLVTEEGNLLDRNNRPVCVPVEYPETWIKEEDPA